MIRALSVGNVPCGRSSAVTAWSTEWRNNMTITTTDPGPLTTDDVSALRLADRVTFHVYQREGYILAHAEEKEVYTSREQKLFRETGAATGTRQRKIPCDYTAFGYTESGSTAWNVGSAPNMAAYAHVNGFAYGDNPWPTTARMLRAADGVTMSWVADNNTGYTRDLGYHIDRLVLHVYRGKAKHVFHVAEAITPDNSARMIRRGGR